MTKGVHIANRGVCRAVEVCVQHAPLYKAKYLIKALNYSIIIYINYTLITNVVKYIFINTITLEKLNLYLI